MSVFQQLCQNWNKKLFRGRPATHVSPEGEETSHHTGGKEKRQSEGRKGEKGIGESVKATIVLLSRSSKDKPVANATLRLLSKSCLTSVYGWLCVSEKNRIVKQVFVCLPLIYFFR